MKLFQKIKDITILGSGDILGSGFSAIFWFYLASQIEPEHYGEIHWFLGIAGIFSAISLQKKFRLILHSILFHYCPVFYFHLL